MLWHLCPLVLLFVYEFVIMSGGFILRVGVSWSSHYHERPSLLATVHSKLNHLASVKRALQAYWSLVSIAISLEVLCMYYLSTAKGRLVIRSSHDYHIWIVKGMSSKSLTNSVIHTFHTKKSLWHPYLFDILKHKPRLFDNHNSSSRFKLKWTRN